MSIYAKEEEVKKCDNEVGFIGGSEPYLDNFVSEM